MPADERLQAFAYKHLVPAQELRVAVSGPPKSPGARIGIIGETPVRIPAGGTARVKIAMPGGRLPGNIQLRLQDPPEGIAIQAVAPLPRGMEIVLASDASRVKPGLRGNLIVTATGGRPGAPGKASSKQAAKTKQRPAPPVTLPAIPFEIVEAVAQF